MNNTIHLKEISKHEETIRGILNPIRWDKYGRVTQYSIYSEEEEDIIILDRVHRKKLEKLVNQHVQAKGKVIQVDEDTKYLRLKNIKALTGPNTPLNPHFGSFDKNFWDEEYSLSIPKEYAFSRYHQVSEFQEGA